MPSKDCPTPFCENIFSHWMALHKASKTANSKNSKNVVHQFFMAFESYFNYIHCYSPSHNVNCSMVRARPFSPSEQRMP
jgi:hypothetical protein